MDKKYTQEELENLSIEELRRIDSVLSKQSKGVVKSLPTQDCSEERQLFEGVRELTSPQDISEILETYLLYNEPCIKIPARPRLNSNTK